MATALTAWLRAPAPTIWTSTAPDALTTPASAPATALGFDRLDTFSTSTIIHSPKDQPSACTQWFDVLPDSSCLLLRLVCPSVGGLVLNWRRGRALTLH